MSSKKRQLKNIDNKMKKKSKYSSHQESRFKYGNYNRYYGYRNAESEMDKRIPLFQKEWFENKSCLDIGCNVGHLTLWIAKHFHPTKMKGVDIDPDLIKAAKSNIVHYIDNKTNGTEKEQTKESNQSEIHIEKNIKTVENLNEDCSSNAVNDAITTVESVELECKPVTTKVTSTDMQNVLEDVKNSVTCGQASDTSSSIEKTLFPYNVTFITESYVPASVGILNYIKPIYDIILCLSVTKWIQLNNGDQGLKLMFQKIYKQLHENGIFLLEPQPFQSYNRRKNITPEIRQNYDSIQLKPEDYITYLLSEEVGFGSYEEIAVLQHDKQGFQRPLYILRK